MTLTIQIPLDTESPLAERARSAGMDVPTYAARVLQEAVARPSLDAMLEPVRKQFARSGMTEEQAAERYEAEKHAARAAKRGKEFRMPWLRNSSANCYRV